MDIANFNNGLLQVIPDFQNDPANFSDGWVYLGNANERYVLGELGEKNMLVFGINPSSATPDNPDNTIRKVRAILAKNGCDGRIMMNLHPQRTADPKALTNNEQLFRNNIAVLKFVLDNFSISDVWYAWGNAIDELPDVRDSLQNFLTETETILDRHNLDRKCYGTLTKKGNPQHPSRVENDKKFYRIIRDISLGKGRAKLRFKVIGVTQS